MGIGIDWRLIRCQSLKVPGPRGNLLRYSFLDRSLELEGFLYGYSAPPSHSVHDPSCSDTHAWLPTTQESAKKPSGSMVFGDLSCCRSVGYDLIPSLAAWTLVAVEDISVLVIILRRFLQSNEEVILSPSNLPEEPGSAGRLPLGGGC